jgi:DNA polymerase II small subunit
MKEVDIKRYTDKGFLVSPDFLSIKDISHDNFLHHITSMDQRPDVLTLDIYKEFLKKQVPVSTRKSSDSFVKIVKSYPMENKKRDIVDWIKYYNNRYERIRQILQNRPELKSAISVPRVNKAKTSDQVTTIGMVRRVNKSAKGNLVITLEDQSEVTRLIVSSTKPELFSKAEEIVPDETIGVVGRKLGLFVLVDSIFFPDIPLLEPKKAEDEAYAVFTSDTHVGSNMFLPDALSKFISWLKGTTGSEKHKEVARKTKYLFITGDLVDGVGVYPRQEEELEISDIFKQYEAFAEYFSQVPEHIQIIICPGNHDALRISEPQHPLFPDIAKPVYDLPNVHMVSNPAVVNIHSHDGFPGFNVLMYHGYSFDHYVANVEKLRLAGGYDRADILMRFLLQKRHLAPSHSSTMITPTAEDFLLIDNVPDIFTVAHIHKAKVGFYKNVINICSSCWQGQTAFQQKVGHNPEPGRIPVVNLKTRQVRMFRFQ